jgi:hypothetical protein
MPPREKGYMQYTDEISKTVADSYRYLTFKTVGI